MKFILKTKPSPLLGLKPSHESTQTTMNKPMHRTCLLSTSFVNVRPFQARFDQPYV
ncbi:hypothetical protein Syun_023254 [Stephania yunnanensis]|uniref:Uncharacterized protein n=1 Tax=Stephania yunnanensis TaxID=152371 RepID=A0AAP0FM84_9MAGN